MAAENSSPDKTNPPKAELNRYWIANMRVLAVLILLWAGVSLGCGVLFADRLNEVNLPGTGIPLGFWFAQQGSIITFVFIILFYCLYMNMLDSKHRKLREAANQEVR
ncbi:MAG: DUF4212 domain-containing protein [Kiritimatiellia bacterium]